MFCKYCGNEVDDNAIVCIHCGCPTEKNSIVTYNAQKDNTLELVVKIFLIIGCVTEGIFIIPLAWCLPITITIFHRFRDHRPIGVGLKICTLLFVNLIAGICLLCMDTENYY